MQINKENIRFVKITLELVESSIKLIVPLVTFIGFLFYVIHFSLINQFPSVDISEIINVLLTIATIGIFFVLYFVVFSVLPGFWLSSLKEEYEDLKSTVLFTKKGVLFFLIPSIVISLAFYSNFNKYIKENILGLIIIFSILFMTIALYMNKKQNNLLWAYFSISAVYISHTCITLLLIIYANMNDRLDNFIILIAISSPLLFGIFNYQIANKKISWKDYIAIPIITISIFMFYGMGKSFINIPFQIMGYGNYHAKIYALDKDYLCKIDFNISKGNNYFVLNSLGNEYYFQYTDSNTNTVKSKLISKSKIYMEPVE